MTGIDLFLWVQPDIVKDFLRILLLLLLASLVRSLVAFVRIFRAPPRLRVTMEGKAETSDGGTASLQSAEEAFAQLHESIVADVKLLRFIGSVMIMLSLLMIGFSASAVSDDLARITRLEGGYNLNRAIQLLALLGVGLTLCTPVYAVANTLEYLLQRHRIKWRRILVNAKRELPVTEK